MTSNTFRAGLIGAGYISEYHVLALRRAGIDIVGICDLDSDRARAVAEKFGLRAFGSASELAAAGATVLHVLTPPHTHASITLDALDLGCHVLVEKPLAVEAEDCRTIERKAAELGLKVCVNHSLLYDPQVKRALSTVRSGKLGKIVSVDILRSSAYPPYAGGTLPPQYRSAGYPFRDLGVHALYLFQAFLGPIEKVDAGWASLGGEPNLAFDEWRALVRCRDGLGQFQLSWNVRPMQSQMIVQGTKGVMRSDLFLMFQAIRESTPLPKAAERIFNALTDSAKPLVDVPINVLRFLRKKILPYHGLQMLVADFYRALAEGSPVPATAADALPVVEWTERVARAADEDFRKRIAGLTLSDRVSVLVTGASGALGSAIVDRLRNAGQRVRILVRRPPEVVPEGVEVALGDLGDPQAVDLATRSVDTVIHAGAAMKGSWAEHVCGTVVGTKNVLEACKRNGVGKLVHISSMSVVDWAGGKPDEPIDENSRLEPRAEDRGFYTRAKLQAERSVVNFHRKHGLPTVILRPGQIFGGRIPLMTAAVARRLGKRWLVLGNGKLPLPLVYMDDVVDGVLAAASGPVCDARVFQLVDTELVTQNDVLRVVAGPDARVIRLPMWAVFSLGKLSELILGILGRKSPLSAYRLRSALARRTFSSTRAREGLGWTPRVGVLRGMELARSPRPDYVRSSSDVHMSTRPVLSMEPQAQGAS
jgi:predicted dehydrogenase/nucleoside-diphosphate-sugar epimerase